MSPFDFLLLVVIGVFYWRYRVSMARLARVGRLLQMQIRQPHAFPEPDPVAAEVDRILDEVHK